MIERPSNLSKVAGIDLTIIIYDSIKCFGEEQARATADRLYARCLSIQRGHTVGHRIDDIRRRQPIFYHDEQPWMIAFRPGSRAIIRIIHGRRNLAKLLP